MFRVVLLRFLHLRTRELLLMVLRSSMGSGSYALVIRQPLESLERLSIPFQAVLLLRGPLARKITARHGLQLPLTLLSMMVSGVVSSCVVKPLLPVVTPLA